MDEQLLIEYNTLIKREHLHKDKVYVESHAGNDLGGNLYYLSDELLQSGFLLYICLKNTDKLPQNLLLLLSKYDSSKIHLIKKESKDQFMALATCKYLITDVQFSNHYRKKEGQICVQTWHGTPLKKLGYDFVDDVAYTGAQKKSFINADVVLYPNLYTKTHMHESYRLDNFCQDNAYINGYPRNSIFFNEDAAKRVRGAERIHNKKVYAYMPTWRGSLKGVTSTNMQTLLLDEVEKALSDDEIFYVKFHRLMSDGIDFSKYTRIKPFPKEYETYEFMSGIDCLITDYSSVMFDFLCTKKKIILFTYDKEEYLAKQGTYFNINDLPFPQVDSIADLLEEMARPKDYDDTKVYDKFCPKDSINAAKELIKYMTGGSGNIGYSANNNNDKKKNLLLYGGNLHASTNTVSFVNFVDQINEEKYRKCICYNSAEFFKDPIRLQMFQLPTDLLSIDGFTWNSLLPQRELSEEFSHQFCNIRFTKIICFVDKLDPILNLLCASDVDITFVVDKKKIKEEIYLQIYEFANLHKVSVVNNTDAINL